MTKSKLFQRKNTNTVVSGSFGGKPTVLRTKRNGVKLVPAWMKVIGEEV